VLGAHGRLGSVGINYLPVNAAPVVDDLVVVPGARYSSQNNAAQPPTVNITFPSAGQNAGMSFDGGAAAPLPLKMPPLHSATRRVISSKVTSKLCSINFLAAS